MMFGTYKKQAVKRMTGLGALAILTIALGSAAPASAPASPTIVCVSPTTLDPAWGNGSICV
jgi:hypothetical protein